MPGVTETTEQKRQWLQNLKVERGCKECGWNEHPEALDFHHRDKATKLFNLGLSCATRSWEALFAEVEKCDVVCVRCHRIETAETRPERQPVQRKKRDHLWWLSALEKEQIRNDLA